VTTTEASGALLGPAVLHPTHNKRIEIQAIRVFERLIRDRIR